MLDEGKVENECGISVLDLFTSPFFFFAKYSVTALNYTWTRSGNFGIDCLTSPLEGTLRFLGISKTRRVPCSSVTARKCCLAAHKAKSNKYAVHSAGAINHVNFIKTLFKCFVKMTLFPASKFRCQSTARDYCWRRATTYGRQPRVWCT